MTNVNKQTFSIGDTAKMSGVSQKQLRNWEAREYIPTVDRVFSGNRAYRRFTMDDVETIRKIKDYLDEGFTLSSAVSKAFGKNPVKEGSVNE